MRIPLNIWFLMCCLLSDSFVFCVATSATQLQASVTKEQTKITGLQSELAAATTKKQKKHIEHKLAKAQNKLIQYYEQLVPTLSASAPATPVFQVAQFKPVSAGLTLSKASSETLTGLYIVFIDSSMNVVYQYTSAQVAMLNDILNSADAKIYMNVLPDVTASSCVSIMMNQASTHNILLSQVVSNPKLANLASNWTWYFCYISTVTGSANWKVVGPNPSAGVDFSQAQAAFITKV
jgi:hypothetical protein